MEARALVRLTGAVVLAGAAVLVGAAALGLTPPPAVAGPADPTVHLSSTVVQPGATVVVTGRHWAPGTVVDVALCGGGAVAGTTACATGSTVDMTATGRGLIWGTMVGAIPPAPCPCVVRVTGVTSGFSEKIPVTVVGASSAPVPTVPELVPAPLHLSSLRVTGRRTLLSDLGGQAPRTLSVRITNSAPYPVTAVLVGRWGPGAALQHVIPMPNVGTLAAGRSVTLRVPFRLSAFSVGSYAVRVTAEVPGVTPDPALTAVTDQWPYLLFACGAVLVLLVTGVVAVIVAGAVRRHRGA